MVTVEQVATLQELELLRQEYIANLNGPLEPFLEELISYSRKHYRLVQKEQSIGYFCVNKSTLLQFHLQDRFLPCLQPIFQQLIEQSYFTNALVSTRDRLGVAVCFDFQKEVSVDDYLFTPASDLPDSITAWSDAVFVLAEMQDVPLIRSIVGDFHDFLHYTLAGQVSEQSIFMLLHGDTLLGTGAIGSRDFQPPYVDIGMCVNPQYRRQQVGTELVLRLRQHCREQGLIPLASCRSDNLASKRTLEAAGMLGRDRILRVEF